MLSFLHLLLDHAMSSFHSCAHTHSSHSTCILPTSGPFAVVMRCIADVMKAKVVANSSDMSGIILFSTVRSSDPVIQWSAAILSLWFCESRLSFDSLHSSQSSFVFVLGACFAPTPPPLPLCAPEKQKQQ
jgi:hypothetical protein